jgi:hypothetical protein
MEIIENEISKAIKEAIENNWYNEMTTSDLQGACEAKARQILRNNGEDDFHKSMRISDQILTGIYDAMESDGK